jgi:hypothetical protein
MVAENRLWGSMRIVGALRTLGFRLSNATVRRYRGASPRLLPTQGWATFFYSHAPYVWEAVREELHDCTRRLMAVLRGLGSSRGRTKAPASGDEWPMEMPRAAGLALRPSLVSFSPWNSLEDYLEVLDFVEEHGLIYNVDPIQYAIRLLVPPGSSLLNIPQMIPHIRELDEENFSYVWEHTEPRVDLLQRQVSRIVEEAAHSHEEEQVTFQRIRGLALSVLHGGTFTSPEVSGTPQGPRSPRLTESWFC